MKNPSTSNKHKIRLMTQKEIRLAHSLIQARALTRKKEILLVKKLSLWWKEVEPKIITTRQWMINTYKRSIIRIALSIAML